MDELIEAVEELLDNRGYDYFPEEDREMLKTALLAAQAEQGGYA